MIINQQLSVAISWQLQGLGHVYKIARLMQTNLRVVPREPGRLLSYCDYCLTMVYPPQCLYCVQFLLFSSFTLWCLKKPTQAQNLNRQFFLWRNVFDKCSSSRDVASGVAMTSGRKNTSLDLCLHTCAFQDNYICVPDRRESSNFPAI